MRSFKLNFKLDNKQLSQSATRPKKIYQKSKPADTIIDKHCDKQSSPNQVKCLECECHIADDTRALNCEACGKSCKCNTCVRIRQSIYDDLLSDASRELQ